MRITALEPTAHLEESMNALRLSADVDMTSVVNCVEIVTRGIYISALFSLFFT